MVKKILQDVLPRDKKTIRHIPLPNSRHAVQDIPVVKEKEKPVRRARNINNMRRYIKLVIFVTCSVIVIAGLILASLFFSSANVTVVPKHERVSIDTVLQSNLKNTSAGLSHELVTASSTEKTFAKATVQKQVDTKASGTIVIYNNFSSASQRLVKNTRFQSTDGHVYRINASVTVPGTTLINGKTVPGSLAVTVYADSSGADYNLKLSDLKGDFTIPGFKDTPRYTAFYGRQQTDITGGFSGIAKVVDNATLSQVTNDLKNKLRTDLWNEIKANMPPEYIIFPSAFFIEYGEIINANQSGDNIEYDMNAVSHAIIFDQLVLSKAIAGKALSDYDNNSILVQNLDAMQFVPETAGTGNVWLDDPFVFNIKGNGNFVWQFDRTKLARDLSFKSKKSVSTVMADYPAITKATVSIKPFWLQNFPSSPNRIKITVKLD